MWSLLKNYVPRHKVSTAFNVGSKLRKFEEKSHPKLAEIFKQTEMNAKRLNVYSAKRYPHTGTMVSYWFNGPHLSADRIVDIQQSIDLNWYIDDWVDEKTSLFKRDLSRTQQMSVLRYICHIWDRDPSVPVSHYNFDLDAFFKDTQIKNTKIRQQIKQCCDASIPSSQIIADNGPLGFYRRYSAALQTHLNCLVEPESADVYPSVEKYIAQKPHKSGMVHGIIGLEYVSQNYLFDHRNEIFNDLSSILQPNVTGSEADAAYPSVNGYKSDLDIAHGNEMINVLLPCLQQMRISTMDICGLSNDLFSLPKEAKVDPHSFPTDNIVSSILQPTDGKTITEADLAAAIEETIEIVNNAVTTFANARLHCLKSIEMHESYLVKAGFKIDDILEYLQHLERLNYGCWAWHVSSDRYVSSVHIFDDLLKSNYTSQQMTDPLKSAERDATDVRSEAIPVSFEPCYA